MSTVSVNLTPELQQFIDSQVRAGQFASASDYIVALVETASMHPADLEHALAEGMESELIEDWSSQHVGDMKQRLIERHSK